MCVIKHVSLIVTSLGYFSPLEDDIGIRFLISKMFQIGSFFSLIAFLAGFLENLVTLVNEIHLVALVMETPTCKRDNKYYNTC